MSIQGSFLFIVAQYLVFVAAQDDQFSCNNKAMCISSPPNCDPNSCQLVADVERKDEQTFTFHVSGKVKSGSYVAIGLSKDGQMGQDAVVACFPTGIQTYINPDGHSNSQKLDWRVGSPVRSTSRFTGDVMSCSFDLPSKIEAGPGISFDLNTSDKITLIVVSGPAQNMVLQRHSIESPDRREIMTSSLTIKSTDKTTPNRDTPSPNTRNADKVNTTPATPATPAPSKASLMRSEAMYVTICSSLAVVAVTLLKNYY